MNSPPYECHEEPRYATVDQTPAFEGQVFEWCLQEDIEDWCCDHSIEARLVAPEDVPCRQDDAPACWPWIAFDSAGDLAACKMQWRSQPTDDAHFLKLGYDECWQVPEEGAINPIRAWRDGYREWRFRDDIAERIEWYLGVVKVIEPEGAPVLSDRRAWIAFATADDKTNFELRWRT